MSDKIENEADWLACNHPEPMLRHLYGKANDRKLRLFACACCRHLGPLLLGVIPNAINLTEQYAEGTVSNDERDQMAQVLRHASTAVWQAVALEPFEAAKEAAWSAAVAMGQAKDALVGDLGESRSEESGVQALLLRDIFGNPFRPVTVESACLTSEVVKLANKIYNKGAFGELPTLADALEKSGCTNVDILAHCRHQEPHARGCWVLDLLLGKETKQAPKRSKKETARLRQMLLENPPIEGTPVIEIGDDGQTREIPYEEVERIIRGDEGE